MDKYLKAIKQNVCSICVDSSERGVCTLTNKETCAVEFYLPSVVEIVHSFYSEDFSEYHKIVKEKICAYCKAEIDGHCYLHEDANCSLDRYFPVIVETIQKVDRGLLN
ncbi:MAG: hypothetical protein FD143_713 [Ignavibacteria bacterium]|nr:MAG: hypothetical protein FD143_713 [Ignavibacteria bacterium]KAF0161326.1 MAG: hypothetical protein FD188_914 [Ignavibacteria bacterium]